MQVSVVSFCFNCFKDEFWSAGYGMNAWKRTKKTEEESSSTYLRSLQDRISIALHHSVADRGDSWSRFAETRMTLAMPDEEIWPAWRCETGAVTRISAADGESHQ